MKVWIAIIGLFTVFIGTMYVVFDTLINQGVTKTTALGIAWLSSLGACWLWVQFVEKFLIDKPKVRYATSVRAIVLAQELERWGRWAYVSEILCEHYVPHLFDNDGKWIDLSLYVDRISLPDDEELIISVQNGLTGDPDFVGNQIEVTDLRDLYFLRQYFNAHKVWTGKAPHVDWHRLTYANPYERTTTTEQSIADTLIHRSK